MAHYYQQKKQSSAKKVQVEGVVQRLDMNGMGVVPDQKKPVFIKGALPNERVVALITEQRSKYAQATLLKVSKPNPHRVKAVCQHFMQCGGCDLQHLAYEQQLAFKQNKVIELFNRQGINNQLLWQPPLVSEPYQYRRKARIGVQYNKKNEPIIGFRLKQSNQLQMISQCHVLMAPFSSIFEQLNEFLPTLSTTKAIGHIEVIATNINTLVVRQLKKWSRDDIHKWQAFSQQKEYQILFDEGNNIVPLEQSYCPDVELSFLVNQLTLTFKAHDFIQVNEAINQTMVQQAIDWLQLDQQDILLDLFCGLGNFSLPASRHVKQVIGVEGVQAMVNNATLNALQNNINNCQFYQADLNNDWLSSNWSLSSFNKVILDPARAGAFEALQQLVKFTPSLILYVSCDPMSLARDSQYLIEQGYKISKIQIMDMFAQTKHVETMVLFSYLTC